MQWLLDTVTVSELRKLERADTQFIAWEKTLSGMDSWISVITLNEISYGTHLIAARDPRFAAQLRNWYGGTLLEKFSSRFLVVDVPTAEVAAEFRAIHRLSITDSLIAATARVHGLILATRNTADFADTGIDMLNPWEK